MLEFSNDLAAGMLPVFFDPMDDRPAYEQLLLNYPFGADMDGFTLIGTDPSTWMLLYPGDPPLRVVSWAKLRDESLVLFEYECLAIIQPDGTFKVHRVD